MNSTRGWSADAVASTVEVEWRRRDGDTEWTEVVLVPIAFEGERMALHFVTETR